MKSAVKIFFERGEKMESERDYYLRKIGEALTAATLEEIKILYAAVVAYIGAA